QPSLGFLAETKYDSGRQMERNVGPWHEKLSIYVASGFVEIGAQRIRGYNSNLTEGNMRCRKQLSKMFKQQVKLSVNRSVRLGFEPRFETDAIEERDIETEYLSGEIPAVLEYLKSENQVEIYVKFTTILAEQSTRDMRYSEDVKQFGRIGLQLFKGKFL
ncbi:hypothetical protein DPMN_029254, partial [Dreissena polymorpha]